MADYGGGIEYWMGQSMLRVSRLLEAAGRRGRGDYLMQVQAAEHGVLRALAAAFGEHPPPLPGMDEIEEREPDVRKDIVMRIMAANE
jgi:hypothetical protein